MSQFADMGPYGKNLILKRVNARKVQSIVFGGEGAMVSTGPFFISGTRDGNVGPYSTIHCNNKAFSVNSILSLTSNGKRVVKMDEMTTVLQKAIV